MQSAGKTPLLIAFGWAVLSGTIAVGYVLIFARKPTLFPVLVILQFLLNTAYSRLAQRIVSHGWLHSLPQDTTLLILVTTSIIFVTAGYALFLVFIQTEGRQTIRAQAELALAHGIQQTLVPTISLKVAGCEIYGVSVPSDKVGGDIVDVVVLPDGGAAAYVADVAGHGLQAGILMGMLKTSARTSLLDRPQPADLFASLNRVMPEVKEAHMYATCFALHIAPEDINGMKEVQFAVAGHPAALRLTGATGEASYLSDEQLPLGLFSFADYRSQTVLCSPGDLLIVATDGVLEVEDPAGLEFGAERVEAIARSGVKKSLSTLAEEILRAATAFGKQSDDQTLLLIRVL